MAQHYFVVWRHSPSPNRLWPLNSCPSSCAWKQTIPIFVWRSCRRGASYNAMQDRNISISLWMLHNRWCILRSMISMNANCSVGALYGRWCNRCFTCVKTVKMHSLVSSCFLGKLKTRVRTKYKGVPKRGFRKPYIYVTFIQHKYANSLTNMTANGFFVKNTTTWQKGTYLMWICLAVSLTFSLSGETFFSEFCFNFELGVWLFLLCWNYIRERQFSTLNFLLMRAWVSVCVLIKI